MPDEKTEATLKTDRDVTVRWHYVGVWFSVLAILLLGGLFGYGYLQLSRGMSAIGRAAMELQAQSSAALGRISALQHAMDEFHQLALNAPAPLPRVEAINTDIYEQLLAIDGLVEQMPLFAWNAVPVVVSAAPSTPPSWWRQGLERSWDALKKIVIVQQVGATMPPMVTPDQKIFLLQNLHAQIQTAIWAVLHHRDDIYQNSLSRALGWVQRYFAPGAPSTQQVVRELQGLQQRSVATQNQ